MFARKRDKTIEDQVEMDDHLLYILGAINDDEAQTRALERFGVACPSESVSQSGVSDFHLAYTRDCARFYAFRGLFECNETGGWDALGTGAVVGAQYRDLGKSGKVHKTHAYTVVRSTDDEVWVTSAFDDGTSLQDTLLPRADAEAIFDPPPRIYDDIMTVGCRRRHPRSSGQSQYAL